MPFSVRFHDFRLIAPLLSPTYYLTTLLGLRGAGSSAWGFFSHVLLLHLPSRLPCWSGYFYEGGAPVFSSIFLTLRAPGLLPLRLPAQSHLGMRSFRMLCASLLCPLLGGLFRLSALGLPCLLPLLSFRWVRQVHSALVDSHSCLIVPWPLSAQLSPSLASPCIQCGSWPLTGWTVPLAGLLLAPSGALESFLLFSLPLRVPLALEIACRTRSAFPLCYLGSLSCWVFSLCSRFPTLALLVLPSGGRVVVSPVSSGSCLPIHLRFLVQGGFSLSRPSTFLGCSVPPDGLFLTLGVFYPYGVSS